MHCANERRFYSSEGVAGDEHCHLLGDASFVQ
jgi:hypothetical protein